MSTEPGSLEASFVDACGPQQVIGGIGDSDQLELLRSGDGRLPADAFVQMRERRRGRPKNARNRRNTDLAKLICQQSGDPILFLSSVYATDLDQLVEMLMIAEGVPQREDRLFEMCDSLTNLMKLAIAEHWDAKRLDVLMKVAERVERAATSMKSKPGEIALKALGHQITSAKETAPYVHSKKPIAVEATHKVDGVIFMPAPQVTAADPIDAVMRRTVEAINSGAIDAAKIVDMRFDAAQGAFVGNGDDASDGDE